MADTYTQLHIQCIFAVRNRISLIPRKHKRTLHRYMAGIIKELGCKPLALHCMPDHAHVFFGMRPTIAISDLMRILKANSSKFINESGWIPGKFEWQQGYSAFSYSKSQIDRVVKYIHNQEEHHRKRSFKEEYLDILEKFEVKYKPEYLFDWNENDAKHEAER